MFLVCIDGVCCVEVCSDDGYLVVVLFFPARGRGEEEEETACLFLFSIDN